MSLLSRKVETLFLSYPLGQSSFGARLEKKKKQKKLAAELLGRRQVKWGAPKLPSLTSRSKPPPSLTGWLHRTARDSEAGTAGQSQGRCQDFPCIPVWIISTWTLLPNCFPFLTIRLHFAFACWQKENVSFPYLLYPLRSLGNPFLPWLLQQNGLTEGRKAICNCL